MELIQKEISIDVCKSHKFGKLPYIECDPINFISNNDVTSGITSGDSNYGQFVCDLKKVDESGNSIVIKYLDIIDKYNASRKILDNGVYCETLETCDGKIIFRECESFTLDNETCYELCKDKNRPFDYTPLDKTFFEQLNDKNWVVNDDVYSGITSGESYVLLSDFNEFLEYENWGVDNGLSSSGSGVSFTFIQYVDNNLINNNGVTNDFTLTPPCIEVPILLEEEYIVDTLYHPYEYSLSSISNTEKFELYDFSGTCVVGDNLVEVDFHSRLPFSSITLSGVEVESKLLTLTHDTSIRIGEGLNGIIYGWPVDILIEGDIISVDGAALFECNYYSTSGTSYPNKVGEDVYQIINVKKDIIEENEDNITYEYGWWECIKIDLNSGNTSGFTCIDGESYTERTESDIKPYKNVTFLNNIKQLVQLPSNGDTYYFMARYQNGKIYPIDKINTYSEIAKLSFPFKIGEPVHIERYDDKLIYDKVISADVEYVYEDEELVETYCNIIYVIGQTSGNTNSGIFYSERLKYEENGYIENILIDGIVSSELYYEKLDYDTNIIDIYNEEYEITGTTSVAKLLKIETGGFNYYSYPLITREGSEKLYFNPNVNPDIVFNRGNGAGWDKFFKLSECNTMRDLENYGNNIFNL